MVRTSHAPKADAPVAEAPAEALAEIPAETAADSGVRTGQVAVAPGLSLHYEVRGEGAPVVILNNFFMTAAHWRSLTRRLAARFQLVTYDLRHQGRSSRVEGELSIEDHVDDLAALIDHLGFARVHLVGTCVSTLIVRDYAIRNPERVAGTVMVGPIFSPFGDLPRTFMHRALLASLRLGGGEALFDHYYPLLYTPKTIQAHQAVGYLALKARFLETNPDAQLLAHLRSTLKVKDDFERLKELTAPTLLLAGDEDVLTSRRGLAILARMIPDARHELIEAAGHNPYVDATAQFEQSVIGFLEEIESRREDAPAAAALP